MPDWLIPFLLKIGGDRIVSWLGRAHDVRITAHRAVLLSSGEPCVFVTATNHHASRNAVITHVWFEVPGPRTIHVLNPERPLPRRLMPDDPWETWIPEDALPPDLADDVLRMAYVRLSTGLIIGSVPNASVPEIGFVPGDR